MVEQLKDIRFSMLLLATTAMIPYDYSATHGML